jgi:hypothetical protein
MMSACNNNQAFFNKRVIPTKITALTMAAVFPITLFSTGFQESLPLVRRYISSSSGKKR